LIAWGNNKDKGANRESFYFMHLMSLLSVDGQKNIFPFRKTLALTDPFALFKPAYVFRDIVAYAALLNLPSQFKKPRDDGRTPSAGTIASLGR